MAEEKEELRPNEGMNVIGWIIFGIGIIVWLVNLSKGFIDPSAVQQTMMSTQQSNGLLIAILGILFIIAGKIRN